MQFQTLQKFVWLFDLISDAFQHLLKSTFITEKSSTRKKVKSRKSSYNTLQNTKCLKKYTHT